MWSGSVQSGFGQTIYASRARRWRPPAAKIMHTLGNGSSNIKITNLNCENKPMHLDMHRALRCHARSKRSGLPCRAPAVRGAEVCRMHGAGGGARKGNKKAARWLGRKAHWRKI